MPELIQIQMTSGGSDCLKLAAVDGNQVAGNQTGSSAESHQSPTCRNERGFVVLAKIGDGLEVRFESVDQPHHLDAALAFGFQTPGRANTLEISIKVEFELIGGVVCGAPSRLGLGCVKTELTQIEFGDIQVDYLQEVIFRDQLLQRDREKTGLAARFS
ncbi:UNVERIFIED_ORG: hypothetical protein J2W16_001180 [Pseudomonas cremoricolorata]|nr:hypothetical protein [Pseudomonas cremoricolorata]